MNDVIYRPGEWQVVVEDAGIAALPADASADKVVALSEMLRRGVPALTEVIATPMPIPAIDANATPAPRQGSPSNNTTADSPSAAVNAATGTVTRHIHRRDRRNAARNRSTSEAILEKAGNRTYEHTWTIAMDGIKAIRRP